MHFGKQRKISSGVRSVDGCLMIKLFQRKRNSFTGHHCSIIVSTKLLNTQKLNVVRITNILESYNQYSGNIMQNTCCGKTTYKTM